MRAVVIHETGGPEVLRVEEVPEPEPGEGEVLVRVEAAGVNRFDLNQRAFSASGFPLVLGGDAAGTRADSGERVVVTRGKGAYAELMSVSETKVWPLPDSLPTTVAAAMPVPYTTAWYALVDHGGLEAGQTLLVQGGASSTGQAAIDIARALGATVHATTSPRGHDRVRELGAEPLAYDDPRVAELEADVVFDPLGSRTFPQSVGAVRREGRVVTPGAVGNPNVSFNLWTLVGKRARIQGIGSAPAPRETMERLIDLAAKGELHPFVERELPLEQAAEAHRLIESGEAVGRVVLVT